MFRELALQPVYTSDDNNIPEEFYNPVLKHAKTFDRTSAYFSARALALYSEGLEYFGNQGLKYRLIISKDISQSDYEQIKLGFKMRDGLLNEMVDSLKENVDSSCERKLSNLAYFIAKGVVDIKIAFKQEGIFHDKCGLLTDEVGDVICFRGSNNETDAAVNKNYESFQVTCSWLDVNGFYKKGIERSQKEFELLWNNQKEDLIVLPAEEVVIREIMKYNKGQVIIDDALLRKEAVVLDYDGQLKMYVNTESTDWLTNKIFYKMQLKHKIEREENKVFYFNPDLVYIDYIKVDELLTRRIASCGYDYFATKRLKDYIQERNLYIEKRAKVGIELKADSTRLENRYQKFKAVVDSRFERKLRDKQMMDAFYMFAMSKSCNFSVPGSGKTSSAIAVYAFLKANDLVDRIVMVGPKNAFGSWMDEFKACFGEKEELCCFNIHNPEFKSNAERKYALKFDFSRYNLFLFNYESVDAYKEEIAHLVSKKTLLVFDEVHKVKGIDGQRANASLEISAGAPYIIAMTGTPIPNSYADIYNLLHILYRDEYKEFFNFDLSFLRNALPADMEMINKKILPFFCRTTKEELLVPPANDDVLLSYRVSEKEQRVFDILKNKYRSNKLALFIRILQLESNPRLLLNTIDLSEYSSILDVSDDIDAIDYVDYSNEIKELIESIDQSTKKIKTMDLIEKLRSENKKVVVWCIFKDSILDLHQMCVQHGIRAKFIMGEVELSERIQLIQDFKNDEYDVLITNPHTLAESVSLHTVCHDAIYFEYSYNLVHLLQSKDRIHRLGLPEGQYTQYYFMQDEFTNNGDPFSIDNKVYERLKLKERVMLEAIDNQVLEPIYTPKEDLEIIFRGLL